MRGPTRLLIVFALFCAYPSVNAGYDQGGYSSFRAGGLLFDGKEPPYVKRLDLKSFEHLAGHDNGQLGLGPAVKFIIDNRVKTAPQIYFFNPKYREDNQTDPDEVPAAVKYHYFFARQFLNETSGLSDFNSRTYFKDQNKDYFAGNLQRYVSNGPTIYGNVYGFSFFMQDAIKEETLYIPAGLLHTHVDVEGDGPVFFVATNADQSYETVEGKLKDDFDIKCTHLDELLLDVEYIAMNQGVAYGFLRYNPRDINALKAIDIPVFTELPLSLSVVAGVLTTTFQDPNSHINLKSKERGTPNAVMRRFDPKKYSDLLDKPVKLTVTRESVELEVSTEEKVWEELRKKLSKDLRVMEWDDESALLSYDDICSSDKLEECLAFSRKVGSKAANLGFLRKVLGRVGDPGSLSEKHGYDISPAGLAIPFTYYRSMVYASQNVELRAAIQALIDAENAPDYVPEKEKLVTHVQDAFYNAVFPKEDLKLIRKAISQALPGVDEVKLRSSGNAEDIPGFDGAGLYDSFKISMSKKSDKPCHVYTKVKKDGSSKLDVKPHTLECGLKAVYASTWNIRAVEERTFARIDHTSVVMGVAVLAAYDTSGEIEGNSVLVTRIVDAPGTPGYQLSVQEGNNVVTNPAPGTLAERTLAIMAERGMISWSTVRHAVTEPGHSCIKGTVLPRDVNTDMVEVTVAIETAYCLAKQGTYVPVEECNQVHMLGGSKDRALDLEYKIIEGGKLLCKQVREFHG